MANLGRVVLFLLLQVFVAKVLIPISFAQFSDSNSCVVLLDDTEESEQNKDLESDNFPAFSDDFFEENLLSFSDQFIYLSKVKAVIPFVQQHHFIEYHQQSIKPPCHS